jgi:hypothetical protein
MATREELYCKFGITAEAAQLFETELGTILIGASAQAAGLLQKQDSVSAQRIHDEVAGYTLGRTLNRLDKVVGIDENIRSSFFEALRIRNQLSHGFYLRHSFKISTEEGRDEMIADLERMHRCLFEAWQLAPAMSAMMLSSYRRIADSDG